MTVEITPNEAELLIAVLTHAENTTALKLLPQDEAIGLALVDLRAWRRALLLAYVRVRAVGNSETTDAWYGHGV